MLAVVVVNADVVLKVIVPDVEERFTVAVEPVARFPFASCACTVTAPEATPAVTVWAAEVIANLLTAAAVIVSVCVPLVNPLEAAVTVGVPDFVSIK